MTTDKIESKVAIAEGFRDGHRVRRGDTFNAPASEKARWFVPAKSKTGEEVLSGEAPLLELSAKDIKAKAPTMTSREINDAISAEQGGKARRNVLAILQDELANRVGQTGGPDPEAKQAEEKPPLVPNPGVAPADEAKDTGMPKRGAKSKAEDDDLMN
jgi:hypothetical protein